jgi:UDP-N-acetylmuramoyl-tripeptide--D-alanyl-D-alanine ligase
MRNLWEALSTGKRGGYADSAAELEAQVWRDSRRRRDHGQGIAGSKMGPIVKALEKRFPGKTALEEAAA